MLDAAGGVLRHNGRTFRAPAPLTEANGAEVVLMLRPEELWLGEAGGPNQLTGQVHSVNFLGAVVRVQLRYGDLPLTLDLFNERRSSCPRSGRPTPSPSRRTPAG